MKQKNELISIDNKLFINNLITFIVFIYMFNQMLGAFNNIYLETYTPDSETIIKNMNMSEIYKHYPEIEYQETNTYTFPKTKLIIILSGLLILILNQHYYLNKKYLFPYLKKYLEKKSLNKTKDLKQQGVNNAEI